MSLVDSRVDFFLLCFRFEHLSMFRNLATRIWQRTQDESLTESPARLDQDRALPAAAAAAAGLLDPYQCYDILVLESIYPSQALSTATGPSIVQRHIYLSLIIR